MSTDPRPLLRVREVAERLGVAERTARGLIGRGVIPSIRVGDAARRVEPEALDAYIESQRDGGVG